MLFAAAPPAIVKSPPAYSAGPAPSSNTVRAPTPPFTPLPSAAQFEPFHLAMLFAAAPPAVVKPPAAYSAGPAPSSNTVRAPTPPFTPLPSAVQVEPFHLTTPPAE